MPGPRASRWGALLVSLSAAACPRTEPSPNAEPVRVEVAGCAAVTRGPVCHVEDSARLTLWIPEPMASTAVIRVGTATTQVPSVEVQGGRRFSVDVPAPTDALQVSWPGRRPAWRLPLAAHVQNATVARARAAMRAGRLGAAWGAIQPTLTAADAELKAHGLGVAARVRLRQGRPEDAVAHFRAAVAADREAGLISEEFRNRFALTYTLVFQLRDLEAARAVLGPLDALEAQDPASAANRPFYEGLVELDTGAVEGPLARYLEAERRAERLGAAQRVVNARMVRIRLLRGLGRYEEAAELVLGLDLEAGARTSPCVHAGRLYNRAWWAYRLSRVLGRPIDGRLDPEVEIRAAVETFQGRCKDPQMTAISHLGLAQILLDRGDAAGAVPLTAVARAQTSTRAETHVHVLHAEARIAEQLDLSRAEAALRRLERHARHQLHAEGLRWAALGRARVLARLGATDRAHAAYLAAHELLEGQLAELPLGEGRASFLEAHDAVGREHVALLLAMGDTQGALRIARKSRNRAQRLAATAGAIDRLPPDRRREWALARRAYIDARRALAEWSMAQPPAWTLAARARSAYLQARDRREADLRRRLAATLGVLDAARVSRPDLDAPAPPGHLVLTLHRAGAAWAAFAREEGTVSVITSTHADVRHAASALLEGHRARIARANTIVLRPSQGMTKVDLHAAEVGGRPLVAYAPVVYSLDVRPRAASLPPRGQALLVSADPDGTLSQEARDLDRVGSALAGPAWTVRRLTGAQVSWVALRGSLQASPPELLHFSGHGAYRGRDGWQSGLQLTSEQWLTAADALTLERPPRSVVLAGCETGATGAQAARSLGLAEAFVLAGAEQAIASTRAVDDAGAARLVTALYRAPWPGVDLPRRLRAAQLELQTSDVDWAAFRATTAGPW